jgi:hypothetical protein
MKTGFNVQYSTRNIQFSRDRSAKESEAQALQGAGVVAQQAGPAGAAGVQRNFASVADHRFGHAEDVCGGNPVAAEQGGVGGNQPLIHSFVALNRTVRSHSAVNAVQDDAPGVQGGDGARQHADAFPVADGGIHAGSVGMEGHRGLLAQKRFDDLPGVGHDG